MDLNDHEEQMDSFEVKFSPKRNVVLLVLCILTWVYCLFLFVYFFATISNTSNNFLGLGIKLQLTYKFYLNYLIVPLLCSSGTVFLLFGKTFGFWIYASGQAITIGISMYSIFGNSNHLNTGLFWGLLVNIIPIAFTVAYASQVFKRKQKPIDLNF